MDDSISLPSQEEIKKTRIEGDKKLSQLSQEQVSLLRHHAKYDKFFLAHGILGYKKLSHVLHNDLCKWLEATEQTYQYREILLPRSHYKSTIVTITDSIQLTLPDDNKGKKYPYDLGKNIRILIVHNKDTKAQEFLYAITMHFLTNPLLMALFPELIPRPGVHRVNRTELCLPRDIISPQQTFSTMGVGGINQGAHFNYIKADDIYGEAERDSASERLKMLQWIDNIQAFLDTPKTDHIDFPGTRWAFDDCFAHIEKNYGKQLGRYVRGAEEVNKETGEKEPIFPEQFSIASFEILKKNRKVWSAQFANNPMEGAAKWNESWLRYYNKKSPRELVVFNGTEKETLNTLSLDRIIFIDPATTGMSGIVVTGTDQKNKIYILEAIKEELPPNNLTNKIFQLVLKYTPRLVVIEEVLFSKVFQNWWIREQSLRKIKFQIEGAKTFKKAKFDRIDVLTNYYANNQIYIDSSMTEFIEEFRQFGGTDDIHMHDALAYGPRYWRPFRSIHKEEKLQTAVNALGSDLETGYSPLFD